MGSPYQPYPPSLATLHTLPSWCNGGGRIDRSACLQLTTRHLWQMAIMTTTCAGRSMQSSRSGWIPKNTVPIAKATVTIDAYLLDLIHAKEPPRTLAGDMRTPFSNAMKLPFDQPRHVQSAPNPNKGACRPKILGLPTTCPRFPDGWEQNLQVHCYQMRPKMFRRYLICPRCQHRYEKLLLPFCTEREYLDSIIGRDWRIYYAARHPNAPGTIEEKLIIERYQILFPPRILLCRNCLNIQYGQLNANRLMKRLTRSLWDAGGAGDAGDAGDARLSPIDSQPLFDPPGCANSAPP